jgi:8-oxo-dGTP diphosphatase
MSEYWDLLDAQARPTGRLHQRGLPLPPGGYHLVISVWTIHRATGKLLLTLRAPEKVICPNLWENTGGSALAGETSAAAAAREVREETGLACAPGDLHFIARLTTPAQAFVDCYWRLTAADPGSVRLQAGETVDYTWTSLDDLQALIEAGRFAPPIISQFIACRPSLEAVMQSLGH